MGKFRRTKESKPMTKMALTWNHHKMMNLAKSKKIRPDLAIRVALGPTKTKLSKVTSSVIARSISKQVTKLLSMNLPVERVRKVNLHRTSCCLVP